MPKPRTVRVLKIADMLGVSHQRAPKIVKEAGFPTPVGVVGPGRVWTRREVEALAKNWRREKPWR